MAGPISLGSAFSGQGAGYSASSGANASQSVGPVSFGSVNLDGGKSGYAIAGALLAGVLILAVVLKRKG